MTFVRTYKPPSGSLSDISSLIPTLDEILWLDHYITVLRDFNFPGIDWCKRTSYVRSEVSRSLVDLCVAWNLSQLVCDLTRGTNYLDIVITSATSAFTGFQEEQPVLPSNHCLIKYDLILLPSDQGCSNKIICTST